MFVHHSVSDPADPWRIDLDNDGYPWVVDRYGTLWSMDKHSSNIWNCHTNIRDQDASAYKDRAHDVSIGYDGTIHLLDPYGEPFKIDMPNFERMIPSYSLTHSEIYDPTGSGESGWELFADPYNLVKQGLDAYGSYSP